MTFSPEFPFKGRYVDVLGSKMHYVEQGDGRVFLFLHGNPTWSYIWRNVIPPISGRGRCVAVDLVGFGRSDRPDIGYTFFEHYSYLEGFIEKLGLKDIVIVGHDWGGALGFRYAAEHPENVAGIAFMETFFYTFSWEDFPPDFRLGFKLFRTPFIGKLMIMGMNIFVNKILPKATHRGLPPEVHANYKKMFPTMKSRYPVYVWPNEIPIDGKPAATWAEMKRLEEAVPRLSCPMLLIKAEPGGIIGERRARWLMKKLPGLEVADIGPGLHYLQEDDPEAVADGIILWASERGLA